MREKRHYFGWGLAVFCTVSAILLLYDTLFGTQVLVRFGRKLLSAATPLIYGAFMAYLLAPVVNFFEFRRLTGVDPESSFKGTKQRRTAQAMRAVGILLTWALIGVLLYLLLLVLIPELYKSVLQLLANVETYYNTISGWIEELLESNPALEKWVAIQLETYYETLGNWVKEVLLPRATTLMGAVSGGVFSGVFSAVGFLGDLLVGMIVSVYFLATKELCAAQAYKVVCSLFEEEQVYWIVRGTRKVDSVFAGFVRGKLLDSLIIGILCFIGCSVLKMPYTPLVSVVVGVTNVIPFFGPFLGAIPSTFLILLASPIKACYFVIFVLALQQLDGNVIGPAILGDKTGLPSLWVIFAILVGGGFFGVAGMFFGVPVCACLYSAANFFLRVRLERKHMPVETEAYVKKNPVKKAEKQAENTEDG